MNIDKSEITRLTEEYGGAWGINHTRRLLHLIALIGEGQGYDVDVVWLAAHLHDWGGYAPWAQPGVDHAVRSTQVAGEFLEGKGLSSEEKALVLECIATHHSGDPGRSMEAILLSDADALDFLGVIGILRDFSKNSKDMRKAYETTRKRREKIPGMLCLEKSREIAVVRIQRMDEMLQQFHQDSFGCF